MKQNLPNNPNDYYEQADHNKKQFMEAMKTAYPELYIVANLMDQVDFNPTILFHVIRHAAEIAQGTGFGQVHLIIEQGIVRFVRGEHSSKLNEDVFLKPGPPDVPVNK